MPSNRAGFHRFSARTIALAGVFAVAMGVTLAAAGNTDAFGAARGTSFAPCLPGAQPISAHFTLANPPDQGPGSVSGVELAGFDSSSCDGYTVVLTLSGNPAGDPAVPATESLGTYDTSLDPCTQVPAARPVVISNGGITVAGCATGGPARYADLHDVTALDIRVGSTTLPTTVLGETFTKTGTPTVTGASKTTSVLATATQLPFTGSWAAFTFWIGVLVLLAGLTFLLLARRVRRSSPPPSALSPAGPPS